MLREMRDAAGDSGEFYTPRAVVRFMVEVTDPRLGETVLDPASGTGGFLVEAYNHLEKQVKTVADRKVCRTRSIFGCEPKSLPYLLCQMNLLLHGLDAPQIDPGNALRFKLSEIGEKERVDVILTNPPFGGEEEKGIQGNFPEDRQTAETALLFLQLIMRKLKRQPTARRTPGPRRRRRAQRHAVRRRRVRPHQGGTAQGLQPAHHRAAAQRRVRALHRHPDEHPVLRPLRPDERRLVLRASAARRAEELHQDRSPSSSTSSQPLHRVVEQAQGERAGMESARRRIAGSELQPRPQEPARQGGHHAPAAGATRRDILEKEQRIAEIMGNIQGLLARGDA